MHEKILRNTQTFFVFVFTVQKEDIPIKSQLKVEIE